MPKENRKVPADHNVFRYRSTDNHTVIGVPTHEQTPAQDQLLVEIDTVYRDLKDNVMRYTGYQNWVGIAQLIRVDEVAGNDA